MLDWLYNLKWFGIRPGLKRIEEAMNKLGNPQKKLKIIHVAGTNGKGSVCAMLNSILQKAGYRVGMYTSPHLIDFRERFRINDKKISKYDVFRIVNKIKETGVELTFFEFTTAIAFQYFYDKGVDHAIIEVGMGGRFDATNIVKPVASIITTISLDHVEWLGDSVDKIAFEKAGVVKEGVPLFTTVDNDAINNACIEKSAPVFLVRHEESTNMNGAFQKKNAGLAAAVAKYLEMPRSAIEEGLFSVEWPARLEFIDENTLLDCAHNSDGIEKMAGFVKTLDYERLIIIFGVMKNKDYRSMIENLPQYDTIVLTKPKIARALDPIKLKSVCHGSVIIEDVSKAYEHAKKVATHRDLILICGSCYLAGELLAYKNKIPIHPIMFVQ